MSGSGWGLEEGQSGQNHAVDCKAEFIRMGYPISEPNTGQVLGYAHLFYEVEFMDRIVVLVSLGHLAKRPVGGVNILLAVVVHTLNPSGSGG